MKKTEIEVIGLCFFNSEFLSRFARTIIRRANFQITEFSFRILLPRLPEYNV